MSLFSGISSAISEVFKWLNRVPEKERKEREREITDYKTPVYNKRQIKAELKFLKDHHRMTQQARGEQRTEYELPPGKTIHEAYLDVIKKLESK